MLINFLEKDCSGKALCPVYEAYRQKVAQRSTSTRALESPVRKKKLPSNAEELPSQSKINLINHEKPTN